ncbi:tRNA 2-thiouridine(34) synthase MnmA [Candidatus Mycoplasma haematominutum]|uniref:tRNA-uridine 2-sulfurtransferase n=1 Tax=Candidatus Mycoplasma haematominutum 'Birmingham 1' TaxID=1116213 RepID=G8C2Z0_9MOLU|nr:tRNA 2-thiouridine(34) synthase MnmA [Candidatus Mycoplasma haematominutum]CCE66688.1 tRNA (5-methylaminomethyl-2-thiouridylate)-methyltransferase [Candidatus Mycoplasma haematominutum 'Birmingham 1']
MPLKPRVVVAMSGGVDSSVAALLLKQQGYEVFGAYMINWDKQLNELDLNAECESKSQDLADARAVAKILDIPLTVYNFSCEYWDQIFCPFMAFLQKNCLGNPDVFCNTRIKFGVFLRRVKKDFGEDVKVASGHYARLVWEGDNDFPFLEVPKNVKKDQTYFLSRLTKAQLREIIFPLSEVESKEEVRKMARENNFPNWNKKGSKGMCFIGKRKFGNFIMKYLEKEYGFVVDIEDNRKLGIHMGVQMYSLNQRKGVNVSGESEKYYVCKKDAETSTLYVCRESQREKYLVSSGCIVHLIIWIHDEPRTGDILCMKFKYTGKFIKGKLESVNECMYRFSHEPVLIPSPGQFAVFYSRDGTRCLGAGLYKEAIF